jgi:hypothetical protein
LSGGTFGPATAPSVLHTDGLNGDVERDVTADVQAGARDWLIRKRNESQGGGVRYYSKEGSLDAFGHVGSAPLHRDHPVTAPRSLVVETVSAAGHR